MTMTLEIARDLLSRHGQQHVLRFWDRLDDAQRRALLDQIAALDFGSIGRMREMLAAREHASAAIAEEIAPAPVVTADEAAHGTAASAGADAIRAGRVGVILVAGGQGSRLGFDGPKGVFPIGPISNASLFEIHARKILRLEQKFGAHVPFYIMTSEANDAATREFFAKHRCFGLDAGRVKFFTQGMWPALDGQGQIILDRPDRLFMSPDGHGGTLTALRNTGMLDDMSRRGLTTLFYFQVDNPLVEIADPAFLGLHIQAGADISVKVCAKRDANEGLGVVALRDGRPCIVEYSDLPKPLKEAREADGRLRFLYGSVAIHVFSLAFLKQEADALLPLHIAHKKVPFCDADGRPVTPSAPNAFKFEKFIFDVLPDARKALNVEFRREDEFSPVKNATGEDSPATTQRDMMRKFARWLSASGVRVPMDDAGSPRVRIEIDPCYATSAEDLSARLPKGFAIKGDTLLA